MNEQSHIWVKAFTGGASILTGVLTIPFKLNDAFEMMAAMPADAVNEIRNQLELDPHFAGVQHSRYIEGLEALIMVLTESIEAVYFCKHYHIRSEGKTSKEVHEWHLYTTIFVIILLVLSLMPFARLMNAERALFITKTLKCLAFCVLICRGVKMEVLHSEHKNKKEIDEHGINKKFPIYVSITKDLIAAGSQIPHLEKKILKNPKLYIGIAFVRSLLEGGYGVLLGQEAESLYDYQKAQKDKNTSEPATS